MTDNTVIFVITGDVLERLPEPEDKYISFLRFWLSDNDTKAVVTLSEWKKFMEKWESELKDCSNEIKEPFFASMRGVVTPYRTKYATEAGLKINNEQESNSIDERTIVTWHYATVRYLITGTPEKFRPEAEFIKISEASILTPKEFFNKLDVEDGETVTRFTEQ
ncbi:MAG: hypothetical protein ACYCT2_08500 [Thermoplasmataceae archaeon]